MRLDISEKIEKINNERILMLNMVKNRIAEDNMFLSLSLDKVVSILNLDEQNIKEYTSINKAKLLIFELTEQIAMTTTLEDVIKLRKKINYYINKIKKELVRRNVSTEILDEMFCNVTFLRKNISMYIRFLRKDSTLKEILALYENVNDLSSNDVLRLKKLATNELNYNKRNLKSMENNQKGKLKKTEKGSLSLESKEDDDAFDIDKLKQFLVSLGNSELKSDESSHMSQNLVQSETYLLSQVSQYFLKYNFADLISYENNIFKNFVILLRNIKKYNWNQKVLKCADRDYNVFYHGEDFAGFIAYSKKRNSLITALAIIFACSHLSKREIECLNNHNLCQEWIREFYFQQSLDCEKEAKLTRCY